MRILFRKKITPLATNVQVNVNNVFKSYDVNKNNNFENITYCEVENTNSTEKDVTSDIQPLNINYNLFPHPLTIDNNTEKNKLTNDKNNENKTNEDHSCLTDSKSCDKENLSSYVDNEPSENTTEFLNEQTLNIHKNDCELLENVDETITSKHELIKEVAQNVKSKSSTFPVVDSSSNNINNNNNQNKLFQRLKTERHCYNGVESNTIDRNSRLSIERVKAAKDEVDDAIKNRKIFSVLGPYNRVRKALRTRGWIEKFDVSNGAFGQMTADANRTIRPITYVKTARNANSSSLNNATLEDSEDGDSDDNLTVANEEKQRMKPWEEENGYYGLLSRMVRSELPRFIWSLRKNQVDFNHLQKDQIINHHSGAPFTTKVGLCKQLRQIRWFADCDADYFFPRCFIISEEDDRLSFINDFRLTACISIVKMIANLNPATTNLPDSLMAVPSNSSNIYETNNVGEIIEDINVTHNSNSVAMKNHSSIDDNLSRDDFLSFLNNTIFHKKEWNINLAPSDLSNNFEIPHEIIEFSIFQCQEFLKTKYHDDLDNSSKHFLTSEYLWDKFLSWYYQIIKMPHLLVTAKHFSSHCQYLCKLLKKYCPQFDMDGVRNVWIVKPGAKSRGRGIICHNRLDDILKIVQGSVFIAEARYVVQKYIERPLLIYKTKFDIRQWFLVTDWAPLTVWWYQDCYLRFCSQEFTLNDFSESIHLCNNCIQHKYKNGSRSFKLPDENMWTWEQFQTWLTEEGHPNLWNEKILPAMKNAVLSTLLSSQESIEPRKNCFGLYGADFLLTANDYRIWLIEINSSPCMSPSTSVTAAYTTNVLEDTLKVVLDRKFGRNSDVGRFELLYRQPFHNPNNVYTGMELYVIGSKINKPHVENSNVLRCFNKETLEINGQSLSDPEVNVMSTVVKDKNDTSPSILRQMEPSTQKVINLPNISHGYAGTTEIVKGMTSLLPPMKCDKFSVQNQHTNHQSTVSSNTDNPVKHLQSIKKTNRDTRSKSSKYENKPKSCKESNVLKSVTNIDYLTNMESGACRFKYNDKNLELNDISHDNNLLKSSRSECCLKPSEEEEEAVKLRSLMGSSGSLTIKNSSTFNLNKSRLHLVNKSQLNQHNENETSNSTDLLNSNHKSIFDNNNNNNNNNNNTHSSSPLLPKIHKNRNSVFNLKLTSLNRSKLTTNQTKKLPIKFEHIIKENLNIDTINNTISSNFISTQTTTNLLMNYLHEKNLTKELNCEEIITDKNQQLLNNNKSNKLPKIVKIKPTSAYQSTNSMHKRSIHKNCFDKIKLNIIQFNGEDRNNYLKHIPQEKSNQNKLYKHLRRRRIVLRKIKKTRHSPVVGRKLSARQSQLKRFKVLIVNQKSIDLTRNNNCSMNLNNSNDCSTTTTDDYDFTINSSDNITLHGNGRNELLKIITSPKSSRKQSSSDSGFDDEKSTPLKTSLPLVSPTVVITHRSNNNNNNNSNDKVLYNDFLPCSFIHSSKMIINHPNTDNIKFSRHNMNNKKFNLKFLSRIANK
ncbi:unnamed protein product [Schistosoma turkestanicum]|nr:unnamed protein product [Schistosoma turkestanicum]